MKLRFRLFCRASGVFYVENTETRQQESLQTKDKNAAQRLYQAKNAAFEQPALNMQLARTYMSASDPGVTARTWKDVYDAISKTKTGSTRNRWVVVGTDPAFGPIWERHILETRAEHLLGVLDKGGVSTNVFLRRLHNFAMDMNWLPWPIIPKKQWPAVIFSPKRAIRAEEHHRIIEIEWNPERRAFYELLWHFWGPSPTLHVCKLRTLIGKIEQYRTSVAKPRWPPFFISRIPWNKFCSACRKSGTSSQRSPPKMRNTGLPSLSVGVSGSK